MTDEMKKIGGDEYQFPDDEYVIADAHAPQTEKTHAEVEQHEITEDHLESSQSSSLIARVKEFIQRYPILQNKRILITIVVAIVALIAFKILSPGHKKPEIPSVPAVPQNTVQQPSGQLLGEFSGLKQMEMNNQNNIAALQQQIQGMRDTLNQANASQTQLTNAVGALAEEVKALSDELKAHPLKKIIKVVPGPKIVYHLTAIIQGRAWITNNFGRSETVSVGDPVTQYGKVVAIDAEHGRVFTTSNKMITYGLYDS